MKCVVEVQTIAARARSSQGCGARLICCADNEHLSPIHRATAALPRIGWLCVLAALVIAPASAWATTNAVETLDASSSMPYGIESRVPWRNSHLTGSAEPPLPYRVKRVFPRLQFREPTDFLSAPSLGRLFVAERLGKVFSFANDEQITEPDLAIDLGKEVPGFTQLYG